MMNRKKIGCLFGSFNPIHVGHLMIAEYMATRTDLDEVQIVVSPHNPLKSTSELADEEHRLEMAKLAVRDNPLVNVNSIEFELDRPSYTIATLEALSSGSPNTDYILIIGGDSLAEFHRWKRWEEILENFGCYVYPRPGTGLGDLADHQNVRVLDVPQVMLSATYIRNCISSGHSTRYLVAEPVRSYIEKLGLYSGKEII